MTITSMRMEDVAASFADGGHTRVKEDETDHLFLGRHSRARRFSDIESALIAVEMHWVDEGRGCVTLPFHVSRETEAGEEFLDGDYDRLALIDRAIDQLQRARSVLLLGEGR